MDLTLRDIPSGDAIERLAKCRDQYGADRKVRIVRSAGALPRIGRIVGARNPHGAQVMLFPVPGDTERTGRLSGLAAIMACERAAAGQTCGSRPDLPACPRMKAIGRKVGEREENRHE